MITMRSAIVSASSWSWVTKTVDRDPDSLFGVQDEIRKRATVSLYQALIGADASRQAEYPDPLEYVLRGRAATLKPRKREDYAQAIGMYERALERDPQFAEAKGWLADNLACRVLDDMADAAAADIARAEGLAEEAVAASPRTAFSHVAKGKVLLAQGRYNEAILEYETARAINPGWPHLYGDLSDCKLWTGSIQEAIPLAEEAIRMHERDYSIASWYLSIGRVHLVQSRTYEAIVWLERHAAPTRNCQWFTRGSPPPALSTARPSAPPLSSHKLEG
jgi:tetratricopeptide (TPR) repeat protein